MNKELEIMLKDPQINTLGKKWQFRLGASASEIEVMLDSLGSMIEAGVPVVDGLDVSREQTRNKYLQDVLFISRKFVEGGRPLHYAFGLFPEVFDPIMLSVIKAGELSGTVSQSCRYVAEDIRAKNELRQKIAMVVVYPAFVMVTLLGVLLFMMIAVIPKMSSLYRDVGQDLPLLTQVVIGLSDFVNSSRFLILIGGILALFFVFNLLLRTDKNKKLFHSLILRIPIVSGLLKEVSLLRFSRTLSVVLKSGVPILDSLDIVSQTMWNKVFRDAVINLQKSVERGKSLSDTIIHDPEIYPHIFLPTTVKVIAVGEKSGTLPASLEKLSVILDKKINRSVQLFYVILEPVLLILLALVVGVVVLAVTLPIYQLPSTISVL